MKTYLIRDTGTGHVKIGKAASPATRLAQLQTGSSTKLELAAVLDGDREAMLHDKFSSIRLYGEWFEDSPDIAHAFASGVDTNAEELAITVRAVRIGGKKVTKAFLDQVPFAYGRMKDDRDFLCAFADFHEVLGFVTTKDGDLSLIHCGGVFYKELKRQWKDMTVYSYGSATQSHYASVLVANVEDKETVESIRRSILSAPHLYFGV